VGGGGGGGSVAAEVLICLKGRVKMRGFCLRKEQGGGVGGCLGVGGVERGGREHGGDSAGGVACACSWVTTIRRSKHHSSP
jgi:hypothetical protein